MTEYFEKECIHHGLTRYKRQPSGGVKCLTCLREYRRKYRKTGPGREELHRYRKGAGLEARRASRRAGKRRKKIYIASVKATGCMICGYNKCQSALHFHHIDEESKSGEINSMATNGTSWDRIKDEIAKCVVLCANCHMEVHKGITDLREYM